MRLKSKIILPPIPTWVYALIISSTSFFRYKSDNFAYWRVIWPWTELLELSHNEIFLDTLFPTFRPFIHLEKIAGEVCGYSCINILNRLVWALGIYFVTYLIFNLISKDNFKDNTKYSYLTNLSIYMLYPVYILFAGFGAFVDVLYPLGLIFLLIVFYKIKKKSTTSKHHYTKDKKNSILITLIGALLVEFARPYGLIILILFGLILLYYSAFKHLFSIVLVLIIASPYHINQFKKTGSIFLTNFSGCYLSEVNKPLGYYRPGKIENGTAYLKKFSHQIELAEICDKARKNIFEQYSKKPLIFTRNIVQTRRVLKLIFPPTFPPYKEIPSPINFRGALYWLSSIATIFMFINILRSAAITFYFQKEKLIPKLLIFLILVLPFIIDLLAHSGNEALRHSLFLYLPLIFFSYRFRTKSFNLK